MTCARCEEEKPIIAIVVSSVLTQPSCADCTEAAKEEIRKREEGPTAAYGVRLGMLEVVMVQ